MNLSFIIRELSLSSSAVPAKDAELRVPDQPGLYSISIDDVVNLPSPFTEYLSKNGGLLIYVGKASQSLRSRLVEQDLRHKKPSTFFRGIGAVLGFRPPAGSLIGKSNQNNYRFNERDTRSIVDWINNHLRIRWLMMAAKETEEWEPQAIGSLRPVLNTTHNPDALAALADLRRTCRQIAIS